MKKQRDRVITFRVDEDENQDLRVLARAEGVKPSELIRQALREKKAAVAEAGGLRT